MNSAGSGSHRRILRNTTIIASASMLNIVAGFLRMKVAAVLLGPAGVGLIGLFQNFVATAASFASLGLPTVGTREIAASLGEADAAPLAVARKSLMAAAAGLALLGMAISWLLRGWIAERLLGQPAYAGAIGWLSIGVALTVYAGGLAACLNGLQRIGDLARLGIASGVLALVAGIGFLQFLGAKGILLFVLAIPAANVLVGQWLVSRATAGSAAEVTMREMGGQWRSMLRLGLAVVVASGSFGLAQLVVRSMVARELGAVPLGHFHAAWTISVTYAGAIFQAMGTDYFPRLSACGNDIERRNRLVGEQVEVLLLLAAPVLLAILTLAPWIVRFAYSPEFSESAGLLRWQVIGDLLKLAGWPIGFIFLAGGDSRKYVAIELAASATFVAATWLLLPHAGLKATSLGFVAMNLAYLGIALAMASGRDRFAWSRHHRNRFLLLLAAALLVLSAARASQPVAMGLGTLATAAFGIDGVRRMAAMTGLDGTLGRLSAACRRWLGRGS